MSKEIARLIVNANAIEVREVPERVTNEEVANLPQNIAPFLYASGNWGPGYVSVKGMVSRIGEMDAMINTLGTHVRSVHNQPIDFIAGNLTGGIIPGWMLSEYLSLIYSSPVGFALAYGSRKGEEKAKIVGIDKRILANSVARLCESVEHYKRNGLKFNFVAGYAPSGMPLGFALSRQFNVPFVYIREARKKGGQKELITGHKNNPLIRQGQTALVVGQTEDFICSSAQGVEILKQEGFSGVNAGDLLKKTHPHSYSMIERITFEIKPGWTGTFAPGSIGVDVEELVNFSETTTNSCISIRQNGFRVDYAATILYYDNPKANQKLRENEIRIVYIVTLSEVLEATKEEGKCSKKAIDDYFDFLSDPPGWQAARGLKRVEGGGTL